VSIEQKQGERQNEWVRGRVLTKWKSKRGVIFFSTHNISAAREKINRQ